MHRRYVLLLFIGLVAFIFSVAFHPSSRSHTEEHGEQKGIGIDEKLGQTIPLDTVFYDEDAKQISLSQIISRPTLLAPVYFGCPDVCSFLLHNLAMALNRLPSEPGKEYQVIAVSFDETEKPLLALEKKRLYTKMIEKPFPDGAWKFLTGDEENIRKLTEAIGFRFQRQGKIFQHPVALVTLSADGKIIRYLYGTEVLPFELRMALLEASEGRVGPTISKVLRFCFTYDPKGRKYVFNTLKVTGIVTLASALSFVLFLLFRGRKRPGKAG